MLLVVYAFIIISVLEYAFPVWSALLEYSSDFIELMQKKAFGIIFPGVHYRDSLHWTKSWIYTYSKCGANIKQMPHLITFAQICYLA